MQVEIQVRIIIDIIILVLTNISGLGSIQVEVIGLSQVVQN